MTPLRALFTPNQAVPGRALLVAAAVWAGLFLLFWSTDPSPIIPRPTAVFEGWWTMFSDGRLMPALVTSFMLNLEALVCSTLVSLLFSWSTVLPVMRPVVAMLSKLRFLGLAGLGVLFMQVATGHELKVWLLSFGMSVFYITGMAAVVEDIPRESFDHARTLRMSPWKVTWHVVILGTLDEAWELMRQNAAIGWMMLTMVEGFLRSEGGIGILLVNQEKWFRLEMIYALQITILLVAIGQDYILALLKHFLFPYAALTRQRS